MRLLNSGGQNRQDPFYSADGVIVAGGTAQLVLGRSIARSMMMLQNQSAGPLYVEFGSARASATISNGGVNAITVTNAGFGFTRAPTIRFYGGGGIDQPNGNTSYVGLGQPNASSPHHSCRAHCVMTGTAPNLSVALIVIDDPGAKYITPPMVFLENSALDPNGVALPASGVGMLLSSQSPPTIFNGTFCTTDPISIWGATTGQAFLCRWSD